MGYKVVKRSDGTFDLLVDHGRLSGLPMVAVLGVRKDQIRETARAEAEKADVVRAARKAKRLENRAV